MTHQTKKSKKIDAPKETRPSREALWQTARDLLASSGAHYDGFTILNLAQWLEGGK